MKTLTKLSLAILIILASCKVNYPVAFEQEINLAKMDTLKWEQFLECSKDQGDWGCDSCFNLIFGHYTDASFYNNY